MQPVLFAYFNCLIYSVADAQVDDTCVDMDLIVEDTEGGRRKSCSFECWLSDGVQEIGEGGVGNVMAPRCDGVVQISAEATEGIGCLFA